MAQSASGEDGGTGRRALTSWKEIAQHTGTSVRTAHRWKDRGMPVHTSARGAPLAYTDELDDWLRTPGPPVGARRRIPLLAVLVCAAAAAWGLGLWLTRPGVPVRLEIRQHGVVALDGDGHECWTYDLADLEPSERWGLGVYEPQTTLIADIDADGRVEVVFNRMPPYESETTGSVYCFNEDGHLRWHVEPGRELTWRGHTFRRDFVGVLFRVVRAGGRRLLLSVSGHRRWAPCQVALLDPATGAVVEEFWHPGTITHGAIEDIDGDGADEVILGGINNPGGSSGRPGLLGLRIPFSSVPAKAESALAEFSHGGPFRYVLFPRSDLSSRLGVVALIRYLWFDEPTTLHVILRSTDDNAGALTYLFSPQLALREHLWAPDLPFRHDQLWRQGLLDHEMTDAETRCLGDVLAVDYVPDGDDPALLDRWRGCEWSGPSDARPARPIR